LLFFNRSQPINKTTIALAFLLPVGLSATLGGLIPGILAAITSFLAFNYFFIQPIGSFTVHNSEDLVILAAFLGVTIVISEMVGRIKRNLAAATDREYEALQLYEFSALLAGATHHEIALKGAVPLQPLDSEMIRYTCFSRAKMVIYQFRKKACNSFKK